MCIGIEGTTPGVEWGKEFSLSVEEQSSPESHEVQVDADGPVCYNFGIPGWAPNLEAIGESNLCLNAVWFLSSSGWNPQVEISMWWVNLLFMINVGLCASSM